ncbi:type II toxin-antitoxin system VapC family toxin [Deltaproteobacteria bacterium TL4]
MYIDTSVLVAYYCPEPNSDVVEQILVQMDQPAISQLTEVELSSAISRKIREQELSTIDGNRVLAQFKTHLSQRCFLYFPIHSQHYIIAKGWISQFTTPLRTLDAIHLAIASVNNLSLLTADIKLADSARHLGLNARLIA